MTVQQAQILSATASLPERFSSWEVDTDIHERHWMMLIDDTIAHHLQIPGQLSKVTVHSTWHQRQRKTMTMWEGLGGEGRGAVCQRALTQSPISISHHHLVASEPVTQLRCTGSFWLQSCLRPISQRAREALITSQHLSGKEEAGEGPEAPCRWNYKSAQGN